MWGFILSTALVVNLVFAYFNLTTLGGTQVPTSVVVGSFNMFCVGLLTSIFIQEIGS